MIMNFVRRIKEFVYKNSSVFVWLRRIYLGTYVLGIGFTIWKKFNIFFIFDKPFNIWNYIIMMTSFGIAGAFVSKERWGIYTMPLDDYEVERKKMQKEREIMRSEAYSKMEYNEYLAQRSRDKISDSLERIHDRSFSDPVGESRLSGMVTIIGLGTLVFSAIYYAGIQDYSKLTILERTFSLLFIPFTLTAFYFGVSLIAFTLALGLIGAALYYAGKFIFKF